MCQKLFQRPDWWEKNSVTVTDGTVNIIPVRVQTLILRDQKNKAMRATFL